jgi:hypothetical protein
MTHLEIGFPAVFSKKVTFWSKPPLSLYGRRERAWFLTKNRLFCKIFQKPQKVVIGVMIGWILDEGLDDP